MRKLILLALLFSILGAYLWMGGVAKQPVSKPESNKVKIAYIHEMLEEHDPINGSLQARYTVYKDQNGETIKHGAFTKWHNNGQKAMEGQFQYDKLHGKFITWHENGQKQFEEEYINGVPHGTFLSWEESGRPFSQKKFINGELILGISYPQY